jgi:N-acetylglucosaminyl-diphospho-decaprenol L-rhamnosyltransferase
VVIATYNGWDFTASCLGHLRDQSLRGRVTVVDNGSEDGTPQRLREAFPEVRVIAFPANRGFGAACNAGIAAGDAPVVVVLNNDVEAEPSFLAELVAPLTADGALGSVAPVLLNAYSGRIDNVGLCVDPTGAGFARLQGLPVDHAACPTPLLLGPSGGAAAYRRTALEEAGAFDERIFLYSEDLDLAMRLRSAGWRSSVAPAAVGRHHGSATAHRRSAWQRKHAGFSRGYLIARYRLARHPRTLLTEAVVVGGEALFSRDLAALRGRIAGWRAARGLPRRALPAEAVENRLRLRASLRLRRADYGVAASAGS